MRGKVDEASAPDPAMAATMEFAAVADTIAASSQSRSPSPAEMAATVAGPNVESTARREGAATIGRFLLLRKLGEGGMGEVFSGYDEQLDRKVAIKLLHAAYAPEETQKRMLREAQALARLSHPNVVAVHEVGRIDGDVFVVMEHIDGQTLREWQDEAPRSVDEILRAYLLAGRGLAAVHAAGMVHRDFKPHNAMIDRQGRVRLLDFGLAHARGMLPSMEATAANTPNNLTSQLTEDGAIAGTPAYMSPEQFAGTPLDARSDQFSFCIALHEALYGKLPARKDSSGATSCPGLAASLARPPLHNDISLRMVDALERGWSRDPARRFPSMNELLEALEVSTHVDPSGQARQRLLFVLLLIVPMAGWFFFGPQDWYDPSNIPRTMVLIALTVLTVAATGTYLFRNTLFKNPFHRVRISALLIMGGSVAVSRFVGVLHHEAPESMVTRDMFLTVLGIAMGLLFLTPRILVTWLTLGISISGLVVLAFYPQHIAEAASLSLNGAILGFIVAWHRSARMIPKVSSTRSDVTASTQ